MKKANILLAGALSFLSAQAVAANCPSYNFDSTYQNSDQVNYDGNLYQAERDVPLNTSPDSSWFWTPIDTCKTGLATNIVERPQRFLEKVTTDKLSIGASPVSAVNISATNLIINNDGEGGFQKTNMSANGVVMHGGSMMGEMKVELNERELNLTTISRGSIESSTLISADEVSTPSLIIDGVDQAALNTQLLQRIERLEAALEAALANQ